MIELKNEASRIIFAGAIKKYPDLMTKYKNAIKDTVTPHMRELNKPSMLSYIEQLAKLYFEVESITEKMDTCLKICQEHPVEISKSNAVDVSIFLNEIDILVKDSFELFIKFSEK